MLIQACKSKSKLLFADDCGQSRCNLLDSMKPQLCSMEFLFSGKLQKLVVKAHITDVYIRVGDQSPGPENILAAIKKLKARISRFVCICETLHCWSSVKEQIGA